MYANTSTISTIQDDFKSYEVAGLGPDCLLNIERVSGRTCMAECGRGWTCRALKYSVRLYRVATGGRLSVCRERFGVDWCIYLDNLRLACVRSRVCRSY